MMECTEVRDRLVALQDGELSPGETEQAREHLRRCEACARLERRLDLATPRARLAPPPHVRAALEDRLDVDVILALADRPPAANDGRGFPVRALRWLRRDAEIPMAAVVGYVVLLAVALGWGVSTWVSLSSLRAETSGPHRAAQTSPVPASPEIPAEQWRPAAYNPETDEEPQ